MLKAGPFGSQQQNLSDLPLWKHPPDRMLIAKQVNSLLETEAEFFDNLPRCHEHPGESALYYCDQKCRGEGKEYFCTQHCLDSSIHNHNAKKIPQYIFEIKDSYEKLLQDIQECIKVAKVKYEPMKEVVTLLEDLANEKLNVSLVKKVNQDYTTLITAETYFIEELTQQTDPDNIYSDVKNFKLIELFKREDSRQMIGGSIDKARYLTQVDENLIFENYLPVIECIASQSEIFKGLTQDSVNLLNRLKMRELEASKYNLSKQIQDLERRFNQVMGQRQ
ncbi:hypothetical protein FGO68_gene3473 [Halteria grandinella]|uniref:Uncharacterized protein n=1 Tax=Halteria grandinella TaxID=5974 RepID=A0A8J8NWZ3_HALGN|nr:hypothetical protein FGO68_gene3473 [Halteria grandinella]